MSTNFYRIRIRIIFVKKFLPNTNTNIIRQKFSTEYEYEYYSVWKYHRIRIRIVDYSNIFECIRIPNYSFSNGDFWKIIISNSCSDVVLHHFISGNNILLFIQLILPQNVLYICISVLTLTFSMRAMLKPGYNYS